MRPGNWEVGDCSGFFLRTVSPQSATGLITLLVTRAVPFRMIVGRAITQQVLLKFHNSPSIFLKKDLAPLIGPHVLQFPRFEVFRVVQGLIHRTRYDVVPKRATEAPDHEE